MKKVIAWICDGPGWAYDARVEAMKAALPQYVHQKVYAVVNTLERVIAEACKADIIVCMYVRYVELLRDVVDSGKVIACIGGKRPFEVKQSTAVSNLPQPMTEQERARTRRELATSSLPLHEESDLADMVFTSFPDYELGKSEQIPNFGRKGGGFNE